MKKALLFIAGSLMIAGIVLFICVGVGISFDFMEFSNMSYATNRHEIQQGFENIAVDTITADVEILPSQDGLCRVVCYEKEKMCHSVKVENGTLVISLVDERNWLDHIKGSMFSFKTTTVTVYLPQKEYSSLKVDNTTGHVKLTGDWKLQQLDLQTTTGDIYVKGVACEGNVSIKVSTGKTTMENVTCENLTTNGSTGKVSLKNVIADGKMQLKRTTGDIKLERCDAGEVYIKTSTGDVTSSFLTPKVITAKATTGNVDVPQLTTGGRCEISVTTGNIRIEIL